VVASVWRNAAAMRLLCCQLTSGATLQRCEGWTCMIEIMVVICDVAYVSGADVVVMVVAMVMLMNWL
jgi:hypothetical protein